MIRQLWPLKSKRFATALTALEWHTRWYRSHAREMSGSLDHSRYNWDTQQFKLKLSHRLQSHNSPNLNQVKINVWTRCHGLGGHSHGCRTEVVGLCLTARHVWHSAPRSWISWATRSIAGQLPLSCWCRGDLCATLLGVVNRASWVSLHESPVTHTLAQPWARVYGSSRASSGWLGIKESCWG